MAICGVHLVANRKFRVDKGKLTQILPESKLFLYARFGNAPGLVVILRKNPGAGTLFKHPHHNNVLSALKDQT